jgi:hypothetical protein
MWHPENDVVRTGGMDDPGGGEFDGAVDHFRRRRRGNAWDEPEPEIAQGWRNTGR